MRKGRILIAEDEELMQITLKDALRKEGYEVTIATDGEEGLQKVKDSDYDIALVDLKMPRLDGMELLRKIRQLSPRTTIIMMTAYGTIETAVEAMKSGAYDYITKPFIIDELLLTMEKAFEVRHLRDENILLHQELEEKYKLGNLIGKSKRMQEVYQLIRTVAQGDSTVLIVGETGTGKELAAHAIHHNSPRRNKPFVKVSCAVLTETLLESELFGHEKGAFTGALKRKPGRFELADEGTLFLDEVDDMNPAIQVKLLRVLQEKEFERVGGTNTVSVDVRMIAASKGDLEEKVKEGRFREDLYYRLNVVPIQMPLLRERKEDIPLLVNHFLEKYGKKANHIMKKVSPEAMALIMEYSWPGNVRELENAVERAVTLSKKDEILPNDLPSMVIGMKKYIGMPIKELKPIGEVLKEIEKKYIGRVLREMGGQKKKAAKILGISRKTLWEKIKSYRLNQ